MKELSIEEKARRYDEALKEAIIAHKDEDRHLKATLERIFPALKESEDDRIRKAIIDFFLKQFDYASEEGTKERLKSWIAWLEKQGEKSNWKPSKDEMDALYGLAYITNKMDDKKDEAITKLYQDLKMEFFNGATYENMFPSSPTNAPIKDEKQGDPAKLSEKEQNRFAKGVLTCCAISFINYLDAHKYEGKMCVSDEECEDIENAFHNAMWDRLHRYYCKYIEKQGEQKPAEWSDEDEEELDNIIDFLDSPSTAGLCPTLCNNAIAWIKSIKERMKGV